LTAWVYILNCGDGSLYVGATSDLKRRLLQHQAGKGGRYTRSHQPVELRFALRCDSLGDAMRLEAKIRHLPRGKKLDFVGVFRNEVQVMENQESRKGGGELLGRAARLADLIAYQQGSVVSKTLLDKGSGTLTLFAFDEGQGLSEHTAPFDAFVHIVDGEAEIVISGNSFRLKEGEVVVMPANEPHSVKAVTRFKMLLVMIRS